MTWKEELEVCGTFYLLDALDGVSLLIAPFFFIYFLDTGLSPSQVGLLLSATYIAILIFEIPTGAIADHFGRKLSTSVACFAMVPIYVGIGLASSFHALLLLMLMHGIAATFWSGAYEAWFIDTLKHHKLEGKTHKYLARTASIKALLAVPAYAAGSLLLIYGVGSGDLLPMLRVMWYIMAFFAFIQGLVILAAKEEYFKRKELRFLDAFKETLKTSKEGIHFLLSNKKPFRLTLGMLFGVYVMEFMLASWQPYFRDQFSISPAYFGFLMAVASSLAFIGLNFSDRLLSSLGHKWDFIVLTTFLSLVFLSVYAFGGSALLAVGGFMLFWMLNRVVLPAHTAYFNEFVPSEMRATVNSVSMMFSMLSASLAMYLGFGLISEWFSLHFAIVLALGVGLLELACYLFVRK